MSNPRRVLGIDPGLQHTGWGVIEADGHHLRAVAAGVIHTNSSASMAERLVEIHQGLQQVINTHQPASAAVEETFMNNNPASALKLGTARGVALLTPALAGLAVGEYPANLVKKSVVGAGHADKAQIQHMIRLLLPGLGKLADDAPRAIKWAAKWQEPPDDRRPCRNYRRDWQRLRGD